MRAGWRWHACILAPCVTRTHSHRGTLDWLRADELKQSRAGGIGWTAAGAAGQLLLSRPAPPSHHAEQRSARCATRHGSMHMHVGRHLLPACSPSNGMHQGPCTVLQQSSGPDPAHAWKALPLPRWPCTALHELAGVCQDRVRWRMLRLRRDACACARSVLPGPGETGHTPPDHACMLDHPVPTSMVHQQRG